MDAKRANEIYDILVNNAGANESNREYFVRWFANSQQCEFRFQGALGFGGKFRRTTTRLRVDCYPEDMTPERSDIIGNINRLLAALPEQEPSP